MYIRSHSNYDPGEQVNRNYQWRRTQVIDPSEHRFGKYSADEKNGAAKCVHPNQLDKKSNFNQEPAIVSEIYSRFIETSRDFVGRVKKTGDIELGEDFVFGRQTPGDEWGARECIRGDYSEQEQAPDPDLGRSLRHGYRNEAPKERIFGTPTIRYDIRAPRNKSIADTQNYGKDPAASASLYPNRFIYKGLDEDDFDTIIPKDDLKDMIMSSGALDEDEDFEEIYDMTVENFATEIEFVKKRDRVEETIQGVTLGMFRQAMAKRARMRMNLI